jgi:hypothetical protein
MNVGVFTDVGVNFGWLTETVDEPGNRFVDVVVGGDGVGTYPQEGDVGVGIDVVVHILTVVEGWTGDRRQRDSRRDARQVHLEDVL